MTAVTVAGTPAAPTPFTTARAMLRLHRPALFLWTGVVLAALALMVWGYGWLAEPAAAAYQRLKACDYACSYDQDAYLIYKDVLRYASYVVTFLPLLVAAWAGATLTSRELESGTAQFAWTQSVTPARWLAAKLLAPAALLTAGTSLLVLLHHLLWAEGRRADVLGWNDILVFQANGPTTVALTLFGLAAGALTGLLLRRSLAALAVTVAVTAAVGFGLSWFRGYFWPTVTVTTPLKDGPWFGGPVVSYGAVTSTGAQVPVPDCAQYWSAAKDCRAQLDKQHIVRFYSEMHPYSHYWPLQLTATALTLALTGLVVLLAFRVLARHTGTVAKGTAV
ncbi:ABC transporter permease [Streptomyces sp. NPDC050564]|uniref:ABC transporter permease n=1 Tax=Streptomyces sp. NPDC050564 TaxID=3365631 RepID=UPI0037B98112